MTVGSIDGYRALEDPTQRDMIKLYGTQMIMGFYAGEFKFNPVGASYVLNGMWAKINYMIETDAVRILHEDGSPPFHEREPYIVFLHWINGYRVLEVRMGVQYVGYRIPFQPDVDHGQFAIKNYLVWRKRSQKEERFFRKFSESLASSGQLFDSLQ